MGSLYFSNIMDNTDDLWGDDDIDEAMLIEASQQVEAEAFNNVSGTKNCWQGISMCSGHPSRLALQ